MEPNSKLALIAFDIKSSVADAVHVKKILAAIRSHLTFYVPTLNVILSVGTLADAKTAFGDGTETGWTGIRPPLGAREGRIPRSPKREPPHLASASKARPRRPHRR